jgi:uncharacterized membrane protein
MSRQFVACKFRSSDTRTYTYHNDGVPVAVGDQVKVADRSGDGWKRVEVAEIDVPEPTRFETKPILGKVEPEAEAAAAEAGDDA